MMIDEDHYCWLTNLLVQHLGYERLRGYVDDGELDSWRPFKSMFSQKHAVPTILALFQKHSIETPSDVLYILGIKSEPIA